MASDVVITAYWRIVGSFALQLTPIRKQLFEYERVHVAAGETAAVAFEVSALNLVLASSNGDLVSMPATYELLFKTGDVSEGSLTENVTITGALPVVVMPFPAV